MFCGIIAHSIVQTGVTYFIDNCFFLYFTVKVRRDFVDVLKYNSTSSVTRQRWTIFIRQSNQC